MLTEAAGDVELVVWNDGEFGHFAGAAIEKYITEFSPISSRGISIWLGSNFSVILSIILPQAS